MFFIKAKQVDCGAVSHLSRESEDTHMPFAAVTEAKTGLKWQRRRAIGHGRSHCASAVGDRWRSAGRETEYVMSESTKHFGGLGCIALGLLAMSAGATMGCGDTFGTNCQETHTCMVNGGSGGEAKGGGDGKGGEDVNEEAGAGLGGSSGTTQDPSEAGAGGRTQDECSVAADCSNGDPKDGEEGCSRGVCMPGNPPPSVLLITPKADSKNVEPDGSIVIEFSEALDPASVTAGSVQVLDGDAAVAGELSYADNKVMFVPTEPLALSGSYQVSVGVGIHDADGAALLEPFSSAFQVRDGHWKTVELAPTKATTVMSQQLPMTPRGDVLVAWADVAPKGCSMSARWISRGGAAMPTVALPKSAGDCYDLTSATNSDGVAAVAWAEAGGSSGVYAWQFRGTQPGSRELVGLGSGNERVSTAVSPDGLAHVLYAHEGETPKARSTNAAGAWPSPAAELKAYAGRDKVTAGFDAQGNGVAVWPSLAGADATLQAATYSVVTGAWSNAATVGSGYYDGGDASLAVAPSGEAVAVWYMSTSAQASYFSGKGWSAPQTISGNSTHFEYYMSRGLVYDGSSFIAAWDVDNHEGVSRTYTVVFDPETGWRPLETHQKVAADGTTLPGSTRIASDGRGTTVVVWAVQGTGTQHQLVYRRLRDAIWGPITPVPDAELGGDVNPPNVFLSMNASGMLALAWINRGAEGSPTSSKLASFY